MAVAYPFVKVNLDASGLTPIATRSPGVVAIVGVSDKGTAAAKMPTMNMGHDTDADEAHFALMAGMDAMDQNMMMGSMAKDLDVAFVCGMIPHHQGAISMAKAELKYGKAPFARKQATNMIDAQ